MIAPFHMWSACWHAPNALFCVLLALCSSALWGQVDDPSILVDQKEGTLVVNYYASAPDPELDQLRGLAVDALGVYLRGQIVVDGRDIGWQGSIRTVFRDMDRLVGDMLRIRSFAGQEKFDGFSQEVMWLLEDFEEMDLRDVERMRGEGSRSLEERIYVLIEQRIQEILLQCGVELGHFVHRGLLQKMGTVEQTLSPEELEQWMTPGDGPLQPIELNFNLETMSLLEGEDQSGWPEETPNATTSHSPEWQSMQDLMQRILSLIESQDARLTALETNAKISTQQRQSDFAASALNPTRISPSSDAELRQLNLPDHFNVQFYEGSARLTLTAQLQLNEVMEFLAMYPKLRVVCTGHADALGDRAANLSLSKRRAQVVRDHLLESGVQSTRVVMNYFGEERASNRGALDRRVEVSFFVDD